MRGAMRTCRRSSLFLHLFAVWKRPTVRSDIETRGGWFHLSAIFIILISRLCWPTFTANCPTNRPRFSSHADRAIACNRSSESLTSRRFLFFLPLPLTAPNAIRDRGWRSNNNNNDCNARNDAWWYAPVGLLPRGMRSCLKTTVPWWTGSLFNLRSRRVPKNLPRVLAHYPCDKTSGKTRKKSPNLVCSRDTSFIHEIIHMFN